MGLAEALRARGYRLTEQRALVLQAVTELGHATPEDAFAWVQERSTAVSLSTVYRTLELLEELDLVTHAHLSHGAPTYHPASSDPHVHVICHRCKAVMSVSPDVVEPAFARLRDDWGFEADVRHLTIFGLCQECAAS